MRWPRRRWTAVHYVSGHVAGLSRHWTIGRAQRAVDRGRAWAQTLPTEEQRAAHQFVIGHREVR